MEQLNIFDCIYTEFKIDKLVRLIELFAGIGSQAMALRDLGADFEHYRVSEWEVNANRSYRAIHNSDDNADYSKKFENFKWLARVLYEYGISVDGKIQLTLKEIRNRGEKWCRQTYNEFRANHNFGSITNAHGLDLRIVDTDKYNYIMTYSFPCQDLSVAGKQRGMTKGSGTRSGLLWEVERLLNEVDNLPQVLLMENVPQVHGKANMADFQKWIDFLESKGYSNYWQDLNAKDYGVAQNRKRCFMVSILGEYNYKFPQPIQLTKTMKDYLEDEVEEKYYLNNDKAQKLIDTLIENNTIPTGRQEHERKCVDLTINMPKEIKTANCIKAKCDDGISNLRQSGNGIIEMKVKVIGQLEGGYDMANRVYDKNGLSPTIRTFQGGGLEPKIIDKQIVAMRGRNPNNPSDRTAGSLTEQRLELNSRGICNTLTSVQKDNLALENQCKIRKLKPIECWRLMGFSDADFNKAAAVNSNSQLYKQAGNSIVKSVLMAIFGQMIEGKEDLYKTIKKES